MALVVPSASEDRLLGWLVNSANSSNLTLKLYKNDVTPDASSTSSTFTVADYSGYSSATLTRGSFTIAQSGGKSVATYTDVTFGPAGSGSQTIYGYSVHDNSGNLLWAERLASSVSITTSTTLTITPNFTLASEN